MVTNEVSPSKFDGLLTKPKANPGIPGLCSNIENARLATGAKNRFSLTSIGYASRAAGQDKEAKKYFQR